MCREPGRVETSSKELHKEMANMIEDFPVGGETLNIPDKGEAVDDFDVEAFLES